ncbi:HNH endonuclease [Deinococcus sp. D7000]|nr:HNH endonuclease [Deinococcus sp. D7000]
MTQAARKQLKARYAQVWDPQRRQSVLVHRALAATVLGWPLLLGEVVHHVDGNPAKNALGNLRVVPSQVYHAH